jgi:hypothetical protein
MTDKMSAEELDRIVGNVETCGGISKLAITREEWGAIRNHIAALEAENERLREAMRMALQNLEHPVEDWRGIVIARSELRQALAQTEKP